MKSIFAALILVLGAVNLLAQSTYDTNGEAVVTLTPGAYTLTPGTNETAWSVDGVTFSTNWPAVGVTVTNGVTLHGVASAIVTLQSSAYVPFFIPVSTDTTPRLQIGVIKVPAAVVDGAILELENKVGVGASVQLGSANLARIVLLNNEDGTWSIKCDPK